MGGEPTVGGDPPRDAAAAHRRRDEDRRDIRQHLLWALWFLVIWTTVLVAILCWLFVAAEFRQIR